MIHFIYLFLFCFRFHFSLICFYFCNCFFFAFFGCILFGTWCVLIIRESIFSIYIQAKRKKKCFCFMNCSSQIDSKTNSLMPLFPISNKTLFAANQILINLLLESHKRTNISSSNNFLFVCSFVCIIIFLQGLDM